MLIPLYYIIEMVYLFQLTNQFHLSEDIEFH